VLFLAR